MAQTAVDLPDPMESPGRAVQNSADDLIAQLAGDEVERMLSEADVRADGGADVSQLVGGGVKDRAGASAVDASLDDLFNQLQDGGGAESGVVAKAAAPAKADATADLNGSLDDLFNALQPEGEAAGKEAALGAAVEANIEAAEQTIAERAQSLIDEAKAQAAHDGETQAVAEPSAAAELAKEMEQDERDHAAAVARLNHAEAEGELKAEPAAQMVTIDETAGDESAGLERDEAAGEDLAESVDSDAIKMPLTVRLLEWMNAPLNGLSEGVREGLGKVAIVTMFNAIAVLIYVALFRKH